MATLIRSQNTTYVRIAFVSDIESMTGRFEKYLTLNDVAGTNLEKKLAPKKNEIIELRVPQDIDPNVFHLYIESYNPERCQVYRDVSPQLAAGLIYVVPLIGDVEPLHRLGKHLNRAGDDYFWLYLAENASLFHAQLNDTLYQEEMAHLEDQDGKEEKDGKDEKDGKERVRRVELTPQKRAVDHDLNKVDTLRDLSYVDLKYLPIDARNIIASTKVKVVGNNRREWADQYTQVNLSLLEGLREGKDFKKTLLESFADAGDGYAKYLNDKLNLVEKILSIPGVAICGGFPAYLVNPYFGNELRSFDALIQEDKSAPKVTPRPPIYPVLSNHFPSLPPVLSPSMLPVPFPCLPPMPLPSLPPMLSNYSTPPTTQIISMGTKAFPFKDIDIFLYGDHDIKETVGRILALFPDSNVIVYKHSITIIDRLTHGLCVQIIKRHYRTLTQVLSGFDLDSCACAVIMEENKEVSELKKEESVEGKLQRVLEFSIQNGERVVDVVDKMKEVKELQAKEAKRIRFYGTDRFIQAVRYGINVVNPHRQSTTFNSRLKKYANRGYFPYIAGQMHLRFAPIYMDRVIRCDKGRHSLAELLRDGRNYPSRNNKREISDYTGDTLAILFQGFKKKEPLKGSNVKMLENFFGEFMESDEYKQYADFEEGDEGDIQLTMERFLRARKYPFKVRCIGKSLQTLLKEEYLYLGWLTRRPGTQANGSFQPTTHNYFGEDQEELIQ
jgi:hypothetical protein